jgi:prolipoprotein diacylglyceryltransferase
LFRRKKFDGQVFAAYLIGYSITRSIAESFRGDYSDLHIHGGLTPAHLISIGIFAAGVALFVVLRRMRPAPRP